MSDFKLHMIAAVGTNGAIGLEGKLPWHKPDDLRIFKMVTTNSNLIVGERTFVGLPPLAGRKVFVWNPKNSSPEEMLASLRQRDIKEAWLCGGAFTYRKFSHLVNGNRLINFIEYDGPFDTAFPFDAYEA